MSYGEDLFNLIKNIYRKLTANIILHVEKINELPQDRKKGKMSSVITPIQHDTGSPN